MKTDRLMKWSKDLRQSSSRVQSFFVVAPARNEDAADYAALATQLKSSSRALVIILPQQLGTVYLTPPGW